MYRFTDSSVARPALTRLWFGRLFPLVPRWVAANLVTLASTGCLVVVLALSLDPARWPPALLAIVFLIATQIYVAGDHLDGMQAVASGTTSPLGDFLDHYCDLWAGCILIFGFWSMLGESGRAVLFALQALLILAFAVTYAEREEHQALHFTRYGTLEAIVLLSVFLVSWTVPAARTWWQSEFAFGLPWYSLLVAVGMAMAIGAVAVIVRRMGRVPLSLVAFATGLAALTIVLTRRDDVRPIEAWLMLAAYGAQYTARVMHGHLVPGSRSWPDPVGAVAVIALAIWEWATAPGTDALRNVGFAVGAYLLASAAFALIRIVGSLRRYWVWVNASGEQA